MGHRIIPYRYSGRLTTSDINSQRVIRFMNKSVKLHVYAALAAGLMLLPIAAHAQASPVATAGGTTTASDATSTDTRGDRTDGHDYGWVGLAGLGPFGLQAGVGTINASGNMSISLLSGEVISATLSPHFGFAQGTAQSSLGFTYSYALDVVNPARLANISTRGLVESDAQVLIAGFIVKDGGKRVAIRAIGRSLAAFGVLGCHNYHAYARGGRLIAR
jgi:hypothetical protein